MNEEKVTNQIQEQVAENQTEQNNSLDIDSLTLDEAKKILSEMMEQNQEADKAFQEMTEKLSALEKDNAENKDRWYRSVAELENYKKRNADTRKNAYFDGRKEIILSILVIGDSLDRALQMPMDEKTKDGLMLVSRQFYDTLSSLGVTEINPVGEQFNPETCEAIHVVQAEEGEEPNMIKTVFKKGYKLEDKIIRYTQVVVTSDQK